MRSELYRYEPTMRTPRSVQELYTCCQRFSYIDEHTIFLPGSHMRYPPYLAAINGLFGIAQLDSHKGEIVAVAGFKIENNKLIITHTPQPVSRDLLNNIDPKIIKRLRSRDFRSRMITQLVELATNLHVDHLLAVPAALHLNVESGLTDYFYVYERVDKVLKRNGFSLNGQFYEYPLSQ